MRFDLQLPAETTREDLQWTKRAVPVLVAAILELRRAGGRGRERELIAIFATDVGLRIKDVQQAALEAEFIRARRAAGPKVPRRSQRGLQAVNRMIAGGELLEETSFRQRLGWSPDVLAKAVVAHRVCFIEHQAARFYPAFYADASYDRRQLHAVTKRLGDLPGGSKLKFFMKRRESLADRTPLEALMEGEFAAVKAAAEAWATG
jgi:hypothetical protein